MNKNNTNNTNEPYIGSNSGQLKDSNIITSTIKLKDDSKKDLKDLKEDLKDLKEDSNDTTFWIDNPLILFSKEAITELWPKENMTREQKINAITRLVLLLTLVGYLFLNSTKILITGIIAIVVLVFTYYVLNKNSKLDNKLRETFSNEMLYEKVKHNFTNPTTINPIMNVLLPEIQDNPERLQAAPSYNKAVENSMNEETKEFIVSNFDNTENIKKKLFDDTGDNFEFEQSMRQFYTTANTRVPNNQAEFSRFCYGNMASCKDGDVEMCLKNAPRPTLM